MLDTHPNQVQPGQDAHQSKIKPPPRANRSRVITAIAVLVAIAVAIAGILIRRQQESEVAQWTKEQAVPTVAIVTPKRGVTGQLSGVERCRITARQYNRDSFAQEGLGDAPADTTGRAGHKRDMPIKPEVHA